MITRIESFMLAHKTRKSRTAPEEEKEMRADIKL